MNKQAKAGKETFGLIIGTRAYFNSELAIDVRSTLLAKLDEAGYGYVILDECDTPTGGSMETLEDGKKCAALFRKHRDEIDGIIVSLPIFLLSVSTTADSLLSFSRCCGVSSSKRYCCTAPSVEMPLTITPARLYS